MNTIGENTFLSKELGPITVGQLVAIVISIVIGVALLCIDGANSVLLWAIVAIILYMLPHLFGAKPKTKAVYPIIFAVIAIIVGAYSVGPAYIDECSSEHLSENDDITVDITPTAGNLGVTAEYTGSSTNNLAIAYCEVNFVTFKSVFLKENVNDMDTVTMTQAGSIWTGTITNIDNSKLYYLFVTVLDDDGDIDTDNMSKVTLTGYAFTGDDTTYTLPGAAYAMLYVLVIFYVILIFTTLIRKKFASTRKKMENAGRLYPQGYGRCTFCGAIVLPGEVNCRKCGAYIDRPESMKPHKKDCFKCSICGAEITEDMDTCPKCGAKFDGIENEVTHEDGTVDVSSDTKVCPVCGKHIPANSERCPKCGKKFDE